MIDALTDPWTSEGVRLAMAEITLLGVGGGLLGGWIVFYGLAYSAESLAHSLLPGLVLAALLGLPLLLGGAAGLLAAAVAVGAAGRVHGIGRDTAVAVVITGLFGAGVLLALSAASPPGLGGLLFGDILGVTAGDVALAAGLALLVAAALRLLHGQLLTVGFDRSTARALGGRPAVADTALLGLLALALLVAVQALGNLLVVALLVAPAATASLLARRMVPLMALAVVLAVAAGIGGLYLSYHARTAAGASVAGVMVALYLLVLAGERLRAARRGA